MLLLGGSEILLRRGAGNTRHSILGVFDIVFFLAGVWSTSRGRIFKETEKYNQIFPTEVEITFVWCLHTALSDFLAETSLAGGSDSLLEGN